MPPLLPQAILCKLNRHRPARDKVHWDGQHYTGTCEHCGTEARRASRGVWRREWMK
ncbi:hypothetical protein EDF59_110157 [Novosphingobium sp. ST904]|nr:hypothetical protein EDF59_110157 [Novosphingobium sp. ST904]